MRNLVITAAATALSAVGCQSEGGSMDLPSPDVVAEHYEYSGDLTVGLSGNVAQVTAVIDADEYRMGGDVWEKASPYIFLFSPATREVLETYSGLGGVRVIIHYPDGSMVAQALLDRSTLNAVGWERALSVAGRARAEGSERPGYMRDLVSFGEENTDFEYNPDYISAAP